MSKESLNKRKIVHNTMMSGMGKLPPQALDLEETLLGGLMMEKGAMDIVSDILRADAFYKDSHQKIYSAIETLYRSANPIDILTVTAQLRKQGDLEMCGGAYEITLLTERISSAENVEYYAKIILQKFMQREMIRISTESISFAYEDTVDVFEMIEDNQRSIFALMGDVNRKDISDMGVLLFDFLEDLEIKPKNGLTGVGSGLTGIDTITGGWQPGDLHIIAARPAMGKCLGRGTRVIMFDGSIKPVEDIVEGDQLMGVDSTPRNVLSLARGQEQMYWVRQNKGIDYRVNESHILSLKRSGTDGTAIHGEVVNISVTDYLSKSDKFKTRNKGYKVGIEFPEKPVEIDPYFLGVWLGDGDPNSQRISNPDSEIVDYLQKLAKEMGMTMNTYKSKDKCQCLSIVKNGGANNEVVDILRKLNILSNKHIPENFLVNSRENRLKLLAGLVDTDGFYDKAHGLIEIIQVRKNLAEQIKYLCHTLGLACTIKEVTKGIKSRNFTGQYHRLIISGDLHFIPTKIKRKRAVKSINKRNVLVTGIRVEKDIVDDYYGFVIDGDHLFMLEDCTVTHNTAFVLRCARNAAIDFNVPTLFFSLEMSEMQLTQRLVSAETGINNDRIRKKNVFEWEYPAMHEKLDVLGKAPLYVDDTPGLNIFEFRTKCRRMKQKHDIGLIIVDYLQLMSDDPKNVKANREQQIGNITRTLKTVAKELKVPVIALSQLSRAVESRPGAAKRPMLSDLRESGNIEQDADLVSFLYRPEYYDIMEDANGESTVGLCEFIIGKNRPGTCPTIKLDFNGAYMHFKDWGQKEQAAPEEPELF